jgi:hypothetical protein
MRLPPAVRVELGPSRLAGVGIGLATLATFALVLATPLPAWPQLAAVAWVLAWAFGAWRRLALRRGRFAITSLTLAHDGALTVETGAGAEAEPARALAGQIRGATCVGSLLTSIVWRADGARASRAILILPDMLPAEDFRRLRVVLRYARSEVAQGAPASHA